MFLTPDGCKGDAAVRNEHPRPDWQKLKFITLWVFAFGLLAHGYCYFNGNFSHDCLYSLYEQSPELMISVGRFLRPVYRLLRGSFTLPVINGFLSLGFLSLSLYLLTELLGINSKPTLALTCGVLTTGASLSLLNASYLHDADCYGLCLFLALLGAWLSLRPGRVRYAAGLCYFLSLGLYQGYISVAVTVFLLLALRQLLEGKKVKEVYLLTLGRLLPILAAMVLYFVASRVVQRLAGIQEAQLYNTLSASNRFSPSFVLDRLHSCAGALLLWGLNPAAHSRWLMVGVNLGMLALTGLLLVTQIRQRHLGAASAWGILGVLAAALLGVNTITLISNVYHYLTMFAFGLLYLAVPMLAPREEKSPRRWQRVWAVLAALLIFDGCLFSNEVYLKKELEQNATLSLFTRIIDRMEQTEGYVPGETEISFAGLLADSPLSVERPGFDYTATGLWHSYSTTSPETYPAYLTVYLGYPARFADEERRIALEQSAPVIAMPVFPAPGSVAMVDGALVIKLAPSEAQ